MKRYEERIKSDREELQREYKERAARIDQEREQALEKYEVKRKALKEMEQHLARTISQSDREKAVLTEKFSNLERQQNELIKTHEQNLERMKEENEQLQKMLAGDKLSI